MTTQEIANRLVELCRTGAWDQAFEELYSPNAVSIEMPGGPWPERCEGMEAIAAKGEQWQSMTEEFHGVEVSDPLIAGNHFTLTMAMDVTMKGMGRSKNTEVCVYKVDDGKIVSEQFFYDQ